MFPSEEAEGPDGREVCRARPSADPLSVGDVQTAVLELGVHAHARHPPEERPAADGKALQQQVMSPQVRGLALCASCVILGSGG